MMVRLHELNLLPETERLRAVDSIRELAVSVPDSGFLSESVRGLIKDDEMSNILLLVQEKLLPDLDNQIENWRYNYDRDDEPDVYFEEFKSTLDDYKEKFLGNQTAHQQIDEALENIEQVIEDLRSEYIESTSEENIFSKKSDHESLINDVRSIFDDVDE